LKRKADDQREKREGRSLEGVKIVTLALLESVRTLAKDIADIGRKALRN